LLNHQNNYEHLSVNDNAVKNFNILNQFVRSLRNYFDGQQNYF